MANSVGYHEPLEALPEDVVDRHRMITSLQEELEAVDWYDQRVAATKDPAVAAILAHNRDEEKEHASMVLEWLRRNDPGWDKHLRTYLFSQGSIVGVEAAVEGSDGGAVAPVDSSSTAGASLGIGSLKGVDQ
jgi:ferritin-like protein